jgi:hypothetical protein
MSYTGVVFSNQVGRAIDRDALEKKRIDDRGILTSIIVGFETRFQTAGNLIFQPPRGSSLFVDGITSPMQTSKGLIKTTIRTIEWSDNSNEAK